MNVESFVSNAFYLAWEWHVKEARIELEKLGDKGYPKPEDYDRILRHIAMAKCAAEISGMNSASKLPYGDVTKCVASTFNFFMVPERVDVEENK